jgi:hypothetical protein
LSNSFIFLVYMKISIASHIDLRTRKQENGRIQNTDENHW